MAHVFIDAPAEPTTIPLKLAFEYFQARIEAAVEAFCKETGGDADVARHLAWASVGGNFLAHVGELTRDEQVDAVGAARRIANHVRRFCPCAPCAARRDEAELAGDDEAGQP